jgi:dipeptidyl-peptidase-4
LVRVDAVTGNAVAYFDSETVRGRRCRKPLVFLPQRRFECRNSAGLQFNKGETAILINNANDLWYYDVAEGVLTRLTNNKESELEEDFSPDGKWVSFVRGNNLFVVDVIKPTKNS